MRYKSELMLITDEYGANRTYINTSCMLSDENPNANRKSEATGSLAPASATRQSHNPYKEQHVKTNEQCDKFIESREVKRTEVKTVAKSISAHDESTMLDRRMYLQNSSKFQRSIARICTSKRPQLAANVAAPVQKLCPLYFEESRRQP